MISRCTELNSYLTSSEYVYRLQMYLSSMHVDRHVSIHTVACVWFIRFGTTVCG